MRALLALATAAAVAGCGGSDAERESGVPVVVAGEQQGPGLSSVRQAMQICLHNYGYPQGLLAVFRTAGYSYEPEDFGGGNVLHWFTSPDGVATVMVAPGDAASVCTVSTDAMGVGRALTFARAALEETANAGVNVGSPERENILPGSARAASEACSGYNVRLPGRLIWVQVGVRGQDPVCVENGTSQIIIRM